MTEEEKDAVATKMTNVAKAAHEAGRQAITGVVDEYHKRQELNDAECVGVAIAAQTMLYAEMVEAICEVGNKRQAELVGDMYTRLVVPVLKRVRDKAGG